MVSSRILTVHRKEMSPFFPEEGRKEGKKNERRKEEKIFEEKILKKIYYMWLRFINLRDTEKLY